jgi:hypothetical protein
VSCSLKSRQPPTFRDNLKVRRRSNKRVVLSLAMGIFLYVWLNSLSHTWYILTLLYTQDLSHEDWVSFTCSVHWWVFVNVDIGQAQVP